ncbi:MAG: ATP-dependent helicase [Promethearchaeota archaeon]
MNSDKNLEGEEFIFEFYDDDYAETLEPIEPLKVTEEYNDVDFEEDLNDEQLEVVNNIKGPMLVIAGAGSGKTRTITYSVAKLLLSRVKPSEIMLVTFTNKAANEMIKRVEDLLGKRPKGIWAGTFHSIANRFIRIYAKTLGLRPNYIIMDESDANALMKLSIDAANVKEIGERFPQSSVAKAILSYSINCNKTIHDVILWKYNQFDSEAIVKKLQQVYKLYAQKKAQDSLVDFDDLLVYWNKLLDEKSVAKLVASRIKYVLVDEYQDTNWIQEEIIYRIVSQNPEHNVIAVGDDAQSIYAFRGANFQNILNFKKKYDKSKVYKITYNYRSVPEILALANSSIQHNVNQFKKKMQPTRKNGIKPYQVNIADDTEQAKFIAKQILKLRQKGFELHQMAVLFRAGHHSLRIEVELKAYNIPYEVRAGVSFFERAHIKDLLMHLRVIENPYDELAWSRIFRIVPGIGVTSGLKIFKIISKTENPIQTILQRDFFPVKMKGARVKSEGQKNLVNHVKKLTTFTHDDDPSEIILEIMKLIKDYVKSAYKNWQERLDDLEQLSIYAQKYQTLRRFLETLSLNISNIESKSVRMEKKKEEEKPLLLSTIHRAKGLEWRVVFIPMLAEGHFPSNRVVGDPDGFEEERRVFYVAVTRAKDQLYLLSPSLVWSFRGLQTARLSQFITELSPGVYKKSRVNFKKKPNNQFVSAVEIYQSHPKNATAKPLKKNLTKKTLMVKDRTKDKEKTKIVQKSLSIWESIQFCEYCGAELKDKDQIICEICGRDLK